jgi:dihydrofolate reductase
VRKLLVFNSVTVDGYFTDENNDMSWAHRQNDPEWSEFTAENAKSGGELLYGRVTYELMVKFWPTPAAASAFPEVAEQINKAPKVVFSRSMEKADWNNARVVKGDLAEEVKKLKEEPGDPLVLMGSGKIISQIAPKGLVDEYQLVVNPIVLGKGRTMFEGIEDKLNLTLTSTRAFKNGNVLLSYKA